jgi:hypothetical protein
MPFGDAERLGLPGQASPSIMMVGERGSVIS